MTNYFFSSDLHYGHKNIIEYCGRPWNNIDDMDEGLIERHNSVVGPLDVTFILGDISFRSVEKTKTILKRMNGRHIHIKGNHDPAEGFGDATYEFHRDFIGKVNGQMFHMYHFPLTSWYHMGSPHDKTIHLHGHIHSAPGTDIPIECKFDVGVDANNWTPVSFDHIMAEAAKRRQNRAEWLELQKALNNEVPQGYHRRPNASAG